MINRNHLLFAATMLGSIQASTAFATLIDFGAASDYNAFIHSNFSATSSDVEGRVAAGGDVAISNYSVNIKNGAQLYVDTHASPALVVGGDLTFSSGQVAGDVYVGGTYNGNASSTITNGSLNQGVSSPIDFDAEFANLIALSDSLSSLSANSSAADLWSTQYLTGAGSNGAGGDLHVFSLDASDMNFSDYLLSDVDDGDAIIFNVSGENVSTSWGNFAGSDSSLIDLSDHILFNFFEADTLGINAAMYGSILAPTAAISSPFGVIEGQVIAASWLGNTQINDNPFLSPTPTPAVSVAEPSSIGLLSLALLGLFTRRKNRSGETK
jgi:choice-of-anchor A domain-containing protein